MRDLIAIDYNEAQPTAYSCGVLGNHNAQPMSITPPDSLSTADYYRIVFDDGLNTYYSEQLTVIPFEFTLVEDVTINSLVKMWVEGYKSNGSYIDKSLAATLTFTGPRASGPPVDINGSASGLVIEVAKNSAARHGHANILSIGKLTEDDDGKPLYDGEPISGGADTIIVDTEAELNELYPTPADGLDAIVTKYVTNTQGAHISTGFYSNIYLNFLIEDNYNTTGILICTNGTFGDYTGAISVVFSVDGAELGLAESQPVIFVSLDDAELAYIKVFSLMEYEDLQLLTGWNFVGLSDDENITVTPIAEEDVPLLEDCDVEWAANGNIFFSTEPWKYDSATFYSLNGNWVKGSRESVKGETAVFPLFRGISDNGVNTAVFLSNLTNYNLSKAGYLRPMGWLELVTCKESNTSGTWFDFRRNWYIPSETANTNEAVSAALALSITNWYANATVWFPAIDNVIVELDGSYSAETSTPRWTGVITIRNTVDPTKSYTETFTREIEVQFGNPN